MTSLPTDQRGWTVVDFLVALSSLAVIALIGLIVWAAIHFIAKFW